MSLLEEFKESDRKVPTDLHKKILFAILNDLFGRKGLDNELDDIIDDDILEEFLDINLEILKKSLS